jgi:hypothetical protein
MPWQDWVLAVGSFIFAVALYPSIKSPDKPALSTSASTAAVLGVFAVTYVTLSLWMAAFTVTLTGIMWTILAVQKYQQDKKPKV